MHQTIPLEWPTRHVFVGGSGSGKTSLLRQMILRGDHGVPKEALVVLVASPLLSSLLQSAWKDLSARGYQIELAQIGKAGFGVVDERIEALKGTTWKLLIVIDDIDHVRGIRGGREWLLDVFGTESHHSNVSIALVAHHLQFGTPGVLNSASAVIICGLPDDKLEKVMKDLGLSPKDKVSVRKALSNSEGKESTTGKRSYAIRLFNHVVVLTDPLYIDSKESPTLERAPRLYQFPRSVLDEPEMKVWTPPRESQ